MAEYKGTLKEKLAAEFARLFDEYTEEVKRKVSSTFSGYLRQIEEYSKKAKVVDVALRYLKNGAVKISPKDKKELGEENIGLLVQVVDFNKRFSKAKSAPAKTKTVVEKTTDTTEYKKLEQERNTLKELLQGQKTAYETKCSELEQQYGEADFVLKRLRELREMPLPQYESALKAMNEQAQSESEAESNAFEKLVKSTYYNDHPTEATHFVQDVFDLIIVRDELQEGIKSSLKDLDAILEGKSPDDSDSSSQ